MLAIRWMLALLIALTAISVTGVVSAQSYPAKPIRWIVAYPPGGGTDFLARLVGAQLSKQMGQPVIVDNRPGGSAVIASEASAKSPPDGYTVFTGDNGSLVFNGALFKTLRYDPLADFAPVGMMARFPMILSVGMQTPYVSARELIAAIQKNPDGLNYASAGTGSPHHLAMELLKQRANLRVAHVPYRGGAAAVQDVIAGQIPITVVDSSSGIPLIRGGKLRPLAVFSVSRIPSLPEVPTLIELGFADVEVYGWQGLVVSSGTPREIVERLSTELQKALRTSDVHEKLRIAELEPIPGDSAGMARYIASETKLWHALIRERKITID